MGRPEAVFVINPLVSSDLKKYIWFRNDAGQKDRALAVFCRLLISEIYIDGFATDERDYIGKRAFNKPIVDIRKLNSEDAVVFIENECDGSLYNVCETIRVVNPKINKEKMVIFGVGKYGTEVYNKLAQKGLTQGIYCYMDSNSEKCGAGKFKNNLPIYNPHILFELERDFSVIEGAEKYMEMDEQLERSGCLQERFYYKEDRYDYLKYLWGYDKNVELRIGTLADMGKAFGGKTIFIYGNITNGAIKTAKMLKLLDYRFGGFLIEKKDADKEKSNHYPIVFLEDVLKDENFYILLSNDNKKECAKRLQELGLKKGIDYNFTTLFGWGSVKKSMWDINLGYTYDEGSQYPGIAVYGEEDETDYKIAILGNSTTGDRFTDMDDKCWPLFLYEKCKDKKVTIYNCGCNGYTSSQELIKLIRDVLPLKPELIIVYDGFIDICENDEKPFAFSYLTKLLEMAKGDREVQIYKGVDRRGSIFQDWLSNIEMMKTIAQIRECDFLAFLQPSRFYVEKEDIDEYFLTSTLFWNDEAKNQHIAFRQELRRVLAQGKYDYIYDLTEIFNHSPEIYIDACHVYEAGNRVIAENILNKMNEKGFLN